MVFCNPQGRSLPYRDVLVKRCGHLYWVKIGIFCCILGTFCAATSAKTEKSLPDLKELLGHLEKQHGNIKTLAVRFRQEKHFSFMNKPVVSKGFMLFSLPKKIRYDITRPFHTTLLDEGKRIERYELVDDKWRPVQLTGGSSIKLVMEQIGQWIQGKFSKQKNLFTMSVSFEDPNTYVFLNLEPRHKQFRRYIEKIRISISTPPKYSISKIDIYEPEGDHFTLDFIQEIVNRDLPKGCFRNPQTAALCEELFLKVKQEDKAQEDSSRKCRSDG
jgi:outer membrane lipoprotein carrier protein